LEDFGALGALAWVLGGIVSVLIVDIGSLIGGVFLASWSSVQNASQE